MPGSDFLDLHPRFRAVADYLAARAPHGRLPGRRHIDPADLKPHLPFINLIDVFYEAGEPRFRYRLVGTAQVEATGKDITGRTAEEAHDPAYLRLVLAGMRAAVCTRQPDFAERAVPHPTREHIRYRRVMFPLADDGVTVDMLLAVSVYLDPAR